MRQPQSLMKSAEVHVVRLATSAEARITPSPDVKTAVDATKPRLPGGACSTSCTIVPLYSPPAEKPCRRRIAVKRSGAAMPMTA